MFNKKKQPPIKSLIAQGSQISGNFMFSDGLRVDGRDVRVLNQAQVHVCLSQRCTRLCIKSCTTPGSARVLVSPRASVSLAAILETTGTAVSDARS